MEFKGQEDGDGSDVGDGAPPAAPHRSATANGPADNMQAEARRQYHECLRNHAAAAGGHVLDGCCEFMPASPEDPLACAACGCHRSFHRREPVVVVPSPSPSPTPASAVVSPSATPAGANSRLMPLLLAPPHMQQKRPAVPASPMSAPAALAESSSEELRAPPPPPPPQAQAAVGSASAPPAPSKKRFRTKFTPEQKERMLEFAHRVGWRVQKPDGGVVDAFCDQVGVPRRVLKVWMHNNKHLAKTTATSSQPLPPLHHDPPPQHHHHQHHPPPPHQQQQHGA